MMVTSLFSPVSTELISAPAGQLGALIDTYRQDLQTGLVDVDFHDQPPHSLVFARGRLINVYRTGVSSVRLDPLTWVESLVGSSPRAILHSLALNPKAVRLIKILIEQDGDQGVIRSNALPLNKQFAGWLEHPIPAMAHVHWLGADALVLLPGSGALPRYTLFISPDKITHSANGLPAIYAWKEVPISTALYSSEPASLAWSEYLLHHAFSRLVGSLLEKFEKLSGRMVFNQVIHDVNFTASAHDWNVTFHASGINDQAIFSSPQEAALVYARLLENINGHIASVVGADIQVMLLRETLARIAMPYRGVLKEFIFA
jgi:hypothetical protein